MLRYFMHTTNEATRTTKWKKNQVSPARGHRMKPNNYEPAAAV